jgi:AraC family L-rhamnose operon transcriptional activator RhaR
MLEGRIHLGGGDVQVLTEAEVFTLSGGAIAVESVIVSEPMCAHSHEFVEFALVREGRARQHTEDGITELAAGSLTVAGPGSWHSYEPDAELRLSNLYLSSDLINGELAWLQHLPRVGPVLRSSDEPSLSPVLTVDLNPAVRTVAEAAFDNLESLNSASLLTRLARLFDVLAVLAPVFEDDSAASAVAARPMTHRHATSASQLSAPYRNTVAHAAALLNDQIDRPWTLETLGHEVSLSTSQLVRVFRADTDMSPVAYLQRIRAERLAYLLRTTSVSIAAAGRAVGWDDPSYASRRFRAYWQMTPHAYRRRMQ